jgi:hypothetical protein
MSTVIPHTSSVSTAAPRSRAPRCPSPTQHGAQVGPGGQRYIYIIKILKGEEVERQRRGRRRRGEEEEMERRQRGKGEETKRFKRR